MSSTTGQRGRKTCWCPFCSVVQRLCSGCEAAVTGSLVEVDAFRSEYEQLAPDLCTRGPPAAVVGGWGDGPGAPGPWCYHVLLWSNPVVALQEQLGLLWAAAKRAGGVGSCFTLVYLACRRA